MQSQLQGRQPDKQQEEEQKQEIKLPRWARPAVIIFALICFAIGAAIWIWGVRNDLEKVMTAIFAVAGVICAFFAMPFLYPSDNSKKSSTPSQQQTVQVINNIFPQSASTPIQAPPSTDPTSISPPQSVNMESSTQNQATVSSNRPVLDEIKQPGSDAIFLFNQPLIDHKEFFGRALERATLINRTRNGASTSIVGPRRIGKSWLISYLRLVAPTELGSKFHIGYLDATSSQCSTAAGFTNKALEILGFLPDTGLDKLGRAIENVISSKETPVLCIDEFEGFISNRQEFNLNFFERLRAMTQGGLVLITISKKPLIDIMVDIVGESSPFFNIFEQRTLKPFKVSEARSFVQAKGKQAGFTDKECTYFLDYAQEGEQQWPPLRLQLVGKLLLEDKITAQTDPDSYLPDTQRYWRDFEKRFDETYQSVVR